VQNAAVKAAAGFVETHLAVVDSVPGSCNMCWEELTLFENQALEPTLDCSHSDRRKAQSVYYFNIISHNT
jgi:hypothetical protein